MKDKKIYLYQELIRERQNSKDDEIDVFSFASHHQIKILMEEDPNYFIGKEDIYFVIYDDKKSCIVMKKDLSYEIMTEWICYLILEILVIKRYGLQEGVEKLKNGSLIKRYTIYELNKNDTYFDILCELLVPSSKIPINLYKTFNHNKILKVAQHFSVREEIVSYKINQFYSKTKYLLDGICLKKIYNSK